MKKILTISLLLACGLCFGQNLVSNGDFEQYDTCTSFNRLDRAIGWSNPIPTSSPDYLNTCSSDSRLSVPSNILGYEYPRSGAGYADIAAVINGPYIVGLPHSYREYIQNQLTDTLNAGQSYCIKFYVSAADSMGQFSDNVGVYFSKTYVHDSCYRCTLPYVPQFENSSAILNSRVGWTEVSGTYSATGGEKFIVIGLFRDSSTIVGTPTGWTSNNFGKWQCIYYVDDVSLSTDLVNCNSPVGIQSAKHSNNVSLFPNPFSTQLTFTSLDNEQTTVSLYNFLGQQVLQQTFTNSATINTEQLANGIYFYELRSNKVTLKTGKVVKQ